MRPAEVHALPVAETLGSNGADARCYRGDNTILYVDRRLALAGVSVGREHGPSTLATSSSRRFGDTAGPSRLRGPPSLPSARIGCGSLPNAARSCRTMASRPILRERARARFERLRRAARSAPTPARRDLQRGKRYLAASQRVSIALWPALVWMAALTLVRGPLHKPRTLEHAPYRADALSPTGYCSLMSAPGSAGTGAVQGFGRLRDGSSPA